jgi:glycosyltransferase involved in cell wall biosynthesis
MKVTAAICVVVKNESRILEHLAYHFAIGFDAAIVIDNGSTDGTFEALSHAAKHRHIRLHRWGDDTKAFQITAFNVFRHAYAWEFDRIAFIDADEYIALPASLTLPQLLEARSDCPAIALPWHIFGSAGYEEDPKILEIEAFRFRNEPFDDGRTPQNFHVKSIVDPKKVLRCINPHYFEVRGEYRLPSGGSVRWSDTHGPGIAYQVPDYSLGKINHLYLRSLTQMRLRASRTRPDVPSPRTFESLMQLDLHSNEVEDCSSSRWAPDVRRELRIMGGATPGAAP